MMRENIKNKKRLEMKKTKKKYWEEILNKRKRRQKSDNHKMHSREEERRKCQNENLILGKNNSSCHVEIPIITEKKI